MESKKPQARWTWPRWTLRREIDLTKALENMWELYECNLGSDIVDFVWIDELNSAVDMESLMSVAKKGDTWLYVNQC